MKSLKTVGLSILVLMFVSASLYPQSIGATAGTLQGTVVDENGAPLPGVLVTVSGAGGARKSTTDADGKFVFPDLTPGMYDVRAELQSYSMIVQSEIDIRTGTRSDITFRMKAGDKELIMVACGPRAVDVSDTTSGANLSTELLSKIPVGRSFASVISLAPGVTDAGIAGGNVSISGASGLENIYIVDGVNITNTGYGSVGAYSLIFSALGSGLPVDIVNEVQVKTGGFGPEYGQALGGVINVVTKSGGNSLTGDTYIHFQPSGLEGDNELLDFDGLPISNRKDQESIDGGVNIACPILKDKLLFFGAYNPRRLELNRLGDPDAPQHHEFPESTAVRTTQSYAAKITANLTSSHTTEISFFGDPSKGEMGFQRANAINAFRPQFQRTELEYGTESQSGRWTGILSSNFFAEAQFARSHTKFIETAESDIPSLQAFLDFIDTANIGGVGIMDVQDGTNVQLGAKFTNIWKSHEFRYGIQYEDVSYGGGSDYSGDPYVAFNGQRTTTGPLLRFRSCASIGLPGNCYQVMTARLSPVLAPTSTKYLNWFAQDSWNVIDHLNLKAGVRWERQAIGGENPGSYEIVMSNNWAPRIGAAYDYLQNGRSKAFVHYGKYFEKIPNDLAVRALSLESTVSGWYTCIRLGPGCAVEGYAGAFDSISKVEGFGPDHDPFGRGNQAGAQSSQEWIAGIEQEVAPGFSAGARFIHRSVHDILENIQINRYPDGSASVAIAEEYLALVFAGYLSYLITNMDGSIPGMPEFARNYKALELTAEKRLGANWQVLASYRLSRLEGNYEGLFRRDNGQSNPHVSSLGDFGQSPYILHTFDIGDLPNDRRHQLKVFGSYQFDFGLNAGFGFTTQTGFPIASMGAIPLYGEQERVIEPRGFRGRTDTETTIDVRADYGFPFAGNAEITVGLDVFNLFNAQAINKFYQGAELDNLTEEPDPDPDFLKPSGFIEPRTVRFFARFAF